MFKIRYNKTIRRIKKIKENKNQYIKKLTSKQTVTTLPLIIFLIELLLIKESKDEIMELLAQIKNKSNEGKY